MSGKEKPAPSAYEVDFFVSYAEDGIAWAEWIAAQLENLGYTTTLPEWDFRPGENRVTKLDEALACCRHTLAIVSPAYVGSEMAAHASARYQGMGGKDRALIPVLVGEGELPPSMAALVPIDLRAEQDEDAIRRRLRDAVGGRVDRVPKRGLPKGMRRVRRFPAGEPAIWELREHRADPHFVGREEVLTALARALRAGRPTSNVQVVTGLWGVGKTRVAIEYACWRARGYDLVWWVRAEDPTMLYSDLAELATVLKLPYEQHDQAVAAVRQELRHGDRHWLLVFDNAEDPDTLLPVLPDRHQGHILITSQRRTWPFETSALGPLPVEATTRYLRRRARITDERAATDLAAALGGLPLAMTQAASVLADGIEAAEYHDLLRQQSAELFDAGDSADYRRTVTGTWRLSTQRLAERAPAAVSLFRLLAFLDPEAVPLARLAAVEDLPEELRRVLTNPFARREAIGALAGYSLVDAGDGQVSVHRLVQTVTRTELGAQEGYWAALALRTVAGAFPADVTSPGSWPVCEALLGHALTSAGHAERLDVETVTMCTLLNRVARYLIARGQSVRAVTISERILAVAAERFPKTALYYDCLNVDGVVAGNRSRWRDALAAQREVYEGRRDLLGPMAVGTLDAGCDLVEAMYRLGQLDDAMALQESLVERFVEVCGADALETIRALAYQATLVYDVGDYRRARDLQERVLAVRLDRLGADHPATLLAKSELASTLGALGDHDTKRVMAEEVLAARRRVLGDEHPHTLTTMADVAASWWSVGEVPRARALREEVVAISTRVLGADHSLTLNRMRNLAASLRADGEPAKALEVARAAADGMVAVAGADNPNTLACLAELGRAQAAAGQPEAARETLESTRAELARLLGPEHLDTTVVAGNLADVLADLGMAAEADELAGWVHATRRRTLGDDNANTIAAAFKYAEKRATLGDIATARAIADEALAATRRLYGEDHLTSLYGVVILAFIMQRDGDLGQAQAMLRQAHATAVRLYGPRSSISTKLAWTLVGLHGGPHEEQARRILLLGLAWLKREPRIRLTGEQKTILQAMLNATRPGRRGR